MTKEHFSYGIPSQVVSFTTEANNILDLFRFLEHPELDQLGYSLEYNTLLELGMKAQVHFYNGMNEGSSRIRFCVWRPNGSSWITDAYSDSPEAWFQDMYDFVRKNGFLLFQGIEFKQPFEFKIKILKLSDEERVLIYDIVM